MSFDPRTVRLGTHIGSDLITAQCLLPGCHWNMHFTPMMRLGQILDVCEQHPCKPEPHTPDVDYLRGAEDALDDIQRQLALAMVGKEEITAAYVAGMLRRTGIELGVQHGERHRGDA